MKVGTYFRWSCILSLTLFLGTACGDSGQDKQTADQIENKIDEDITIDKDAPQTFKINNVVFSIPSPYQFALFLKENKLAYDKAYLTPTSKVTNLTSNITKSLSLGIYGCDLAYLNIYEQIPDAISYFSVVKKVSTDIGLENTFDPQLMKSIEANMGNQDSLLYILGKAYRNADAYLKDNDRQEMASLILTGGWIESLYILTEVYESDKNQEVLTRIAEQKRPLENLLTILSPSISTSPEIGDVFEQLREMAFEFDGVEYDYKFIEPTVKPAEKLTVVNSEAKLTINEEQYRLIREKIVALRNSITK